MCRAARGEGGERRLPSVLRRGAMGRVSTRAPTPAAIDLVEDLYDAPRFGGDRGFDPVRALVCLLCVLTATS